MPQSKLRLPIDDILAITTLFQKHFLEKDSLWVFGSRTDLTKRGGDIDLYIETSIQDHKEAVDKKTKFACDLMDRIGEQKIDIVLNITALNYDLPIYQIARSEGIKIA